MVYEYDSKCIMKCVPHPITDIIIIQFPPGVRAQWVLTI